MRARILFLLMLCLNARAATVTIGITNYDMTLATNDVIVSRITERDAEGSYQIIGLPVRKHSTNGVATFSLLQGDYQASIYGVTTRSNLIFAVPSGSGTLDLWGDHLWVSGGNVFNYSPGVQSLNGSRGDITNRVEAGTNTVVLHVNGTNIVSARTDTNVVNALIGGPKLALSGGTMTGPITNAYFFDGNDAVLTLNGGFAEFLQDTYVSVGKSLIGEDALASQTWRINGSDGSATFGNVSANLNASQLASGTVPNARFPATLPAASGVNLTALNASQLTSGTVPVARLPLNGNQFNTANSTGSLKDGALVTNLFHLGAAFSLTNAYAGDRGGDIRMFSARSVLGQPQHFIGWYSDYGTLDGYIRMVNDHDGNGLGNTPEMALVSLYDMAVVLGEGGGFCHLGQTPFNAGLSGRMANEFHLHRNMIPNSTDPCGDSAALGFKADYWNGSAVISRGFGMIYTNLDSAGNTMLMLYPRFKSAFGTSRSMSDDASNISQGGIGTNTFYYKNIAASNDVTSLTGQFNGNGAGITNLNYAQFWDEKANGTQGDNVPGGSGVWGKATLNTTGMDSASAFTLSSSVLTVNAAGAGRWKVRATVPLISWDSGISYCRARLRRTNNTAATLALSQPCVATAGFEEHVLQITRVISLAAGDTLELQGYGLSGTVQFGRTGGSDGEAVVYSLIEFERQ